MSGPNQRRRPLRYVLAGLTVSASLMATGCQMDVGGQNLPSPYYMTDDVQYFASGPEAPLSNERAAMQAVQEEHGLR